jgi:colanic acid/amylovoran biosynthesis glycosyltransferase
VTVAYLVNQYPQTSHTFIRREIHAVEKLGLAVERFAIRRPTDTLVDQRDRDEAERTTFVLESTYGAFLVAVLKAAVSDPVGFLSGLFTVMRLGVRSHRGLLMHMVYLAEACVLLGWFRERGVVHVHSHFGTNSTMVAMLCHLIGGPPFSFTSHGPEEYDKPEALALAEKVHRSRFAVAISAFGRSQLCRWSHYEDWPKIKVVRCGVDDLFLRRNSPSCGGGVRAGRKVRLVNVGRLAPAKGQLVLIEAAGILAADGEEFELVVIGDGSLRGDLELRIQELGLTRHVRLTGWLSNDQVQEEILKADVMVLPSFAEGLPLVLMEALALHRPVVSTFVGGIPELVTHGVCGWLVPAGSTDDLAAALREVVHTPPERLAEMGRAGAVRVGERHDVTKEARKLLALFREAGATA